MHQVFTAGCDVMGIGGWEIVSLLALLLGAIVIIAVGVRLALWWRDR